MASVCKISGLNNVIAYLREKQKSKVAAIKRGLKMAALTLQGYSMDIVPIWQGILRDSSFTRFEEQGARMSAIVGYTAAYAIYVHEIKEAAHGAEFNAKHAEKIAAAASKPRKKKGATKYPEFYFNRGENQAYKFLERPFREHLDELKTIIKEEVNNA